MRKRSEARAEEEQGTVEEASKPLAEEMAKEDLPRRMTFDTAHRAKETPLEEGFEQIVESIHIQDVKATYDKLEKALRVGETRNERGVLLKALDNAETNARQAHKLWMNAKLAFQRWEADNEVVFSAMWIEANKALQHEKDTKGRSKQITDADVRSMCAAIYGDEYKHQETRRRAVKNMVDSCENLCELWVSRCKSLNTMLGKDR